MPYTEKTYNTDAILKKLDATISFSVDAIIALVGTKTYDLDILLRKFNIVKTYSIDSITQKQDISKTYSLDVQLETGIRQIEYLLDVAMKKIDGTLNYSVDVRLRNADGDVYLIDTILFGLGVETTYSLDYKAKLADIIATYLLDTTIQTQDVSETYSVDCVISDLPAFSTISNSAGSLRIKPLSINERQSCHPAIRDIPLAQVGQILDSGTYTIDAKESTMKFRVSSTERDTLELIFDANEKVTVYLFSGASYWKNIGWFREKSYTYSYSKEDDDTREWLVTTVFDFESSTFTLSNVETNESGIIFLYSLDENLTPDLGTLYIDGVGYDTNGQSITANTNHLLYGGDLDFGTHTLDFIYPPMATFDHWEVTGAISVEDPSSQTTNITITGSGTITAVYNTVFIIPNWLTGWGYRKNHLITASVGAGTNYPIKITVHYGNGVDGNGDVYCNSKCLTDFNDIRFTDNDGDTELDYWIESKVDSDNAVFWVEVKDTLESNATIYVYYGKSDATTTSNGDNTFLFFDDFDDLSIDTDKWNINGIPVENGGILDTNNVICYVFQKTTLFNTSVAIRFRGGVTGQSTYASYIGVCDSIFAQFLLYPHSTYGMFTYNGTITSTQDTITTPYHIFEIRWLSSSSVKYSKDDGIPTTHTTNIPTVDMGVIIGAGNNGYKAVCDWILVRKCITVEPANSTWGTEEIEE